MTTKRRVGYGCVECQKPVMEGEPILVVIDGLGYAGEGPVLGGLEKAAIDSMSYSGITVHRACWGSFNGKAQAADFTLASTLPRHLLPAYRRALLALAYEGHAAWRRDRVVAVIDRRLGA